MNQKPVPNESTNKTISWQELAESSGWIVVMSFDITSKGSLAALFSCKCLLFTQNPQYFFPIWDLCPSTVSTTHNSVPQIRYKRVCSAHECHVIHLLMSPNLWAKLNQGFSVQGIFLPSGNDWSRWGTDLKYWFSTHGEYLLLWLDTEE